MHRANLTLIVPLVLLAATVAISVTVSEDAFARERYSGDSTSQAAAVSNDCLNPILDSNTIDNLVGVGNCGGTISQQDESGQASAPITSQSANPTIELQRATSTTQPPLTGTPPTVGACVGCFDMLSDTAQSEFEEAIPTRFQMLFPGITTIEQLCAALNSAFLNDEVEVVNSALDVLDSILNDFAEDGTINQATHSSIISCLTRLYG
jgi:hypothetical protein